MPILNDTFSYNLNGDIIITKNDKPDEIIDKIIGNTEYDKLERGIGLTFSKKYIGDLMFSGFYNESSAGSVQLAMMLNYLKDNNFVFCNFGMDDSIKNNLYKRKLGAIYIDRADFIRLWREGRE